MNSLTTEVGLKVGPVVLETLIKHYFNRIKNDSGQDKSATRLRQDELLYHEAFNVVKTFLSAASFHTVEEVQGFSNTRTPSPPWVRVVRVTVPMSSCDEAAAHLIRALGGEDVARSVIGGVKWWQVRGINGVDAQWITARKDWQEAKRRHKEKQRGKQSPDPPSDATAESATYEQDMDEMRCILYSHGGGYYFGSVDQERYSIQRHARKINGRVFAVNYRLAPQYPFPCALQDLVAAYIYLIKPPPGACHRPVNPAHIIIAGDSAGGGISLALLQVIRDSGLPMPAGGVLISPWCDLTHSFPSVHTNTATDVIPAWGLSLQKPSILWPPPSDEMTNHVHASLRSRIRQTFRMEDHTHAAQQTAAPMLSARQRTTSTTSSKMPVDVGATTSVPPLNSLNNQTISLVAQSGETLTIDQQVHLYTQNSLLPHPLISSALSYLGGLPPLLIIAGDKEVLRDEIIYAACKAANPEKYPLKDSVRAMYPPLNGIETRYKATKVHLQVYDDSAHILPVLFSFTTPAKFCFRAIASFCKHVTGMPTIPQSPTNTSFTFTGMPTLSKRPTTRKDLKTRSRPGSSYRPNVSDIPPSGIITGSQITSSPDEIDAIVASASEESESPKASKKSLRRSLSTRMSHASLMIRRRSASAIRKDYFGDAPATKEIPPLPDGPSLQNGEPKREGSSTPSDVGGARFQQLTPNPGPVIEGERTAGDPTVYDESLGHSPWQHNMIRERVSTQGVIRPLESESELDAFKVPPEIIGVLSELAVRRYLNGRAKFDKKFAGTIKSIEKQRKHNLERARKETINVIENARQHEGMVAGGSSGGAGIGIKDGLIPSSGSWSWAWVLDGEERPPPSSIASRRDTEEARNLAKIADQQDDYSLSGNNFWSVVVNYFTVTPDRERDAFPKSHQRPSYDRPATMGSTPERRKSKLSRFMGDWLSPERGRRKEGDKMGRPGFEQSPHS